MDPLLEFLHSIQIEASYYLYSTTIKEIKRYSHMCSGGDRRHKIATHLHMIHKNSVIQHIQRVHSRMYEYVIK